jgi:hypothetical protein
MIPRVRGDEISAIYPREAIIKPPIINAVMT